MKIGIMQPYFLPYLGYFALINAVDKFVYLDDVQYIRRGWVNRNRIKFADNWHYISLPMEKAPQSININESNIVDDENEIRKIKTSIQYSYEKAPNYSTIKEMLFDLIIPGENISKLNISLAGKICRYLDITTDIYISSGIAQDTSLKAEEKIINICKILNCDHYINPLGGVELYSKISFSKLGIKLNFIQIKEILYYQGKGGFIPNLSIIDVLMWNSRDDVRRMLDEYTLVEGAA